MYFKIYLLVFAGILTSFFSISCSLNGNPSGKPEITEVRINHFRQTAMGEGPYLVYLMQEDGNIGGDQWNYLYDGIEGFDFLPGYIYDLRVKKITIENPSADGSSIKYILVNVRNKQKVPENEFFQVNLKSFGYNFVWADSQNLSLLGEYAIDCNNICVDLTAALEDQTDVTGTFIHGPNQSLVLQSIN